MLVARRLANETDMRIEHTAYQVQDPVAAARWYVQHLGMTLKRAQTERPFTHFIADDGNAVLLEFYNNPKVPVPDYCGMDPLVLHIAFYSDDVHETRRRLLAAGATAEGDVQVTPAGDTLAMLRDPWGLPIQLAHRSNPMI
jgi:catechol 2,3-dioxygenase-like lactoylglutathione lyase family enzyme